MDNREDRIIARLTAERDEARRLYAEVSELRDAREAGYRSRANGAPCKIVDASPDVVVAWIAGWRENHNRIVLGEIRALAQEIASAPAPASGDRFWRLDACERARKILALCGGA